MIQDQIADRRVTATVATRETVGTLLGDRLELLKGIQVTIGQKVEVREDDGRLIGEAVIIGVDGRDPVLDVYLD